MIRSILFGKNGGFGDGRRGDEHYFSRSMQRGRFGIMTGYAVTATRDTTSLPGLANIGWFAESAGKLYAQDQNGKLYQEQSTQQGDFSLLASPASSAPSGMVGDAKGRLLAFRPTIIDMYDGISLTSSWKTGLYLWSHPADTYEGMTIFGNGPQVGLIDSADAMNTAAFTLPSSMLVNCLKAGKNGILIGASLNSRGCLILWDARADRSIAPWIWTSGDIKSIERVDTGWIVVTSREILLTNGYTTQKLASAIDDPLGFAVFNTPAQGIAVANNKAFILNQVYISTVVSSSFGRLKPGVLVLDLGTHLMEYVPISTGNMYTAVPGAIYAFKGAGQEIAIGYADNTLGTQYIGQLKDTGASSGAFISEPLADSPSLKAAEGVILNLAPATSLYAPQPLTFTVSVKVYNFRRPLWGQNLTNAGAASASQIRVDGTSTSVAAGRAGDEVTVLTGANAGQVRHIATITNAGASNETWTLDSALPNITGSSIYLNVQPFELLSKKTFSAVSELTEEHLYFAAKNKVRGQKFLVKVVFENIASGLQLELHPSQFLFDDLGSPT